MTWRCAAPWHHSLATLALLALSGCGLTGIAENIRDDDDDGWFTNATNQAVVLTIASASFPLPGQYRILVDEIRFPPSPELNGTITVPALNVGNPMALGLPVATRTIGTNLLDFPDQLATFSATVTVQRLTAGLPITVGTGSVEWTNRDAAFSVTLGSATVDFSTTRTFFADPSPADPDGDSDGDGIGERDEAELAQGFGGLGDPRPGGLDLLLIVGHTHPASALLAESRELLKTRFAFRGIAMHIDDGQLNGSSGSGGLMTLDGQAVADGTNLTIAEARTVRDQNVVIGNRRTFAYFALLARDQVTCGGTLAFGCGEFPGANSGNVLVMISRLVDWLPEIENFQAGVLMHELGHNLGLCHPTVACASGALPAAEADPAVTIMGTPAENPPIDVWGVPLPNPLVLVNAMARPLDYSATQWTNLQLGAGLGQ